MRTLFLLVSLSFGLSCFSQISDSLNPFTDKEILKLSNQIYELEKRDSLARASEPNGFELKDQTIILDKSLLVDLNNDSVHFYTGQEVIMLSNYLFELEKRDSIRMLKSMQKVSSLVEYQLEEEEELQYFESVVYFKFDSYVITVDSYKPLNDVVEILNTYKNLTFVIEGYCDIIGSKSYNKILSLKRANAVKNYFLKKGIVPSRVSTVTGFGADKFAAPNNTSAGRAKNRRVIIKAVH